MHLSAFDEEIKDSFTEEIVTDDMDEKTIQQQQYRKISATDGPFVETKECLG